MNRATHPFFGNDIDAPVKSEASLFQSEWGRWLAVVVYAAAMAWVESAVVFYLRSMIGRIEPYQVNPLPIIGGFARVELTREFATLVMLFAVGMLAGRNWRARAGYMVIAFGVWDIFYYVFLKVICGWPHSLLDWDILFLLPMPWWGPVLAPVLIALLMIGWGTMVVHFEESPGPWRFNWRVWSLNFAGVMLALYVFMADSITASHRGLEAIRMVLPERFRWGLFLVALVLMAAPVWGKSGKRESGKAETILGLQKVSPRGLDCEKLSHRGTEK